MSSDAPRLAPIPPDRWGDAESAALKAGMPPRLIDKYQEADGPTVPHVLGTFVHHPEIAGPFLAYNRTLMGSSVVETRLKELMVLRVAWRTRSAYEWAQHTKLAPRYAITEEEIAKIDLGADADGWTPLEADLLRATDQMLDSYRIDDETWARLAKELTEPQLMEVVFVVGTYTCLAMAFNSFGLQVDPGTEPAIELPTTPEAR